MNDWIRYSDTCISDRHVVGRKEKALIENLKKNG